MLGRKTSENAKRISNCIHVSNKKTEVCELSSFSIVRARAQWRASSHSTPGWMCSAPRHGSHPCFHWCPPMKFLFQSRWRNSQLAVPNLAHHVRGKRRRRRRQHTSTLSAPRSSNPLSLPIYPRHHPGSAPPLFFLCASLIIRQTHLFPINKPLSLRAGEGMVGV